MFNIKFFTMWIIVTQVFWPACYEIGPLPNAQDIEDNPTTNEKSEALYPVDAPLDLQAADFFFPGSSIFVPPDPILPPFFGPEDDGLFDDFLDLGPGFVLAGVCGDAVLQPMEQCDDGNLDNLDGCNVICLLPICGNGALELFEQCDDNNNVDADGCTRDCVYERCGNFRVEVFNGEECDDGNLKAGDGCSPCCKFERCGNRVLDPHEECDDGNLTNGDGCSDCCELEESTELPENITK
jgi:cysteine-rich repeat protein